ncbi:LRR 8 domain containing protein [Asbolus verrucosus]|uniref:LRR 8 domain containing protein n=1 Tax=Asbolus verrucosus TaxID=1661398 RepID=A0A482VYY9_ASBVE|nr:LRR 8 domain containing protein [Asbolus verrucosus]
MSEFDIILDSSQQNLKEVPARILQMCNLKMLYLQKNYIIELPKDFFLKLHQLSWLDLRNNQLTTVPESIAHHQHLENLLLSDNKIETLPNELGLVPKLKVLQIANNPIAYPSHKIIAQGTKSVCSYLKNQYEKTICPRDESEKMKIAQEEREMQEEKEIRVVEDFANELPVEESINSSLVVKSLSKDKRDERIIHKITKDPAHKIHVKSYYDEDKCVRASTQTSDYSILSKETLKQNWLDKLKVLLEEQEKILQQERLDYLTKLLYKLKIGVCRNLQALSSWRNQKLVVPPTSQQEDTTPYATYPEYDTILSRADLTKQIDKLIERNRNPPKKEDLGKLINDLIGQLKDMETTYVGTKSPRAEIEAAGTEIKKIMDVHKKLLKLQQVNALT